MCRGVALQVLAQQANMLRLRVSDPVLHTRMKNALRYIISSVKKNRKFSGTAPSFLPAPSQALPQSCKNGLGLGFF